MISSIWFLASAMFVATTATAVIAFQHSPDRSAFAAVQWSFIAAGLVAPLFLIAELLSDKSDDGSARRRRAVRVVILVYLPLACALSLMAFGQR